MPLAGLFRRWRSQWATARVLVALSAIYLFSQVVIVLILDPLGPLSFLRAQITFSRETYLSYLAGWEAAGLLSRYRAHFLLDCAHPFWYASALGTALAIGLNRQGCSERWNGLLWMPIAGGLCDLVENLFHISFVADPAGVSAPAVFCSALAANTKWALLGLSMLAALGLVARAPRRLL